MRYATPKRYQRRCPKRTPRHRIAQTHLEAWRELTGGDAGEASSAHIERTFRRYITCLLPESSTS
jgi:hypothetical protein